MTNPWTSYTRNQLILLQVKAERAARIHRDGGRPYMAELCAKRATELALELATREA